MKQEPIWKIGAVGLCTGLLLALLLAAPLLAANRPVVQQQTVFNEDLRVRSGEFLEGDVTVLNGDVTVDSGSEIRGSLVVYAGEVAVEAGGGVVGDITAFSGDVQIDGNVGGSITALSGDVDLGGDAFVGGDISVVSGEVDQQRGAVVKGSVLRGPSTALDLPDLPALAVPPPVQQPSLLELLWDLVGRIVLAVLLLGLAAGVGVLLVRVRPAWVENSRRVLVDRTALSFAAGLLFNLVGGALIALLWLSVCFRPPALLLALLFGAVNLVGLAALGDEIGLRANARLGLPRLFRPAIGILLPGIVVAFFWILGSCFGFFASLTALLVSALGTGAVLVSALKLSEPPAARAVGGPEVAAEPSSAADGPPADEPPAARAVGGPEVAAEPFSAADEPLFDLSERAVQEAEAVQRSDNFTRINGIGIVFDQRLKAAGIVTFAQLARCTPAEIAKIVLWPEGRIRSSAIIEQAQALADEQG